jgi:hypothetical protein
MGLGIDFFVKFSEDNFVDKTVIKPVKVVLSQDEKQEKRDLIC